MILVPILRVIWIRDTDRLGYAKGQEALSNKGYISQLDMLLCDVLAYLVKHVNKRVNSFREHGCRSSVEIGYELDNQHCKITALNNVIIHATTHSIHMAH